MATMRITIIAMQSIVVASTFWLAGCALLKPGPTQVARQFLWHLDRYELEKASQMVSSRIRQMGDGKVKAVMEEIAKQLRSRGGVAKTTAQSEDVTGDVAKVSFAVQFKNGQTSIENFKLFKEQNEWKVDFDK